MNGRTRLANFLSEPLTLLGIVTGVLLVDVHRAYKLYKRTAEEVVAEAESFING